MSRPSNAAILWLFTRVALRRAANSSTIFVRRSAENLSKVTSRKATVHRGLQKTLGSRAFTIFFGFSLVLGTALLVTRTLPALTLAVRLDEMATSDVIKLSPSDYEALQKASTLRSDPKQPLSEVDKAFERVVEGSGNDWMDKRAKQLLHDQFQNHGLAGFR
ncbi:MAG TPA: hypothetical protein VGP63_27630, partial [Planctomycetaceae bacterium]|nr:hypothetical protein [Planctomycetaceae bacterium]